MCPVQFLQPVENSFGAVWELKLIILPPVRFSFFSFFFFSFLSFFFFFCFCLINGIQKTDILKSGLVRNHSLDGTVEIRFTMPLPALMVWRKTTCFFLILGIFPMFWRVMIFYSKPHCRPCLLNLSTKANGVEPVLTVIKMSGLARVFWSIIR